MRVLITRPKYQSEQLVKDLVEQGYQALLMPLLDIQPIKIDELQKHTWFDLLMAADLIIAISANAASLALPLLEDVLLQNSRKSRAGLPIYAIGPSTAGIFNSAGFVARYPEGKYNSESLLSLPELNELKNKKVVILCGEGGREYLEVSLQERGAIFERIELYERVGIEYDTKSSYSHIVPDVLTAMSGDTVNALATFIESSDELVNKKWKKLPIVVPSERVARIAFERSFTKILTAAKPTSDSLLDTLGQLDKSV